MRTGRRHRAAQIFAAEVCVCVCVCVRACVQVLVTAPSNVAVDHLTEKIHRTGLKVMMYVLYRLVCCINTISARLLYKY